MLSLRRRRQFLTQPLHDLIDFVGLRLQRVRRRHLASDQSIMHSHPGPVVEISGQRLERQLRFGSRVVMTIEAVLSNASN